MEKFISNLLGATLFIFFIMLLGSVGWFIGKVADIF